MAGDWPRTPKDVLLCEAQMHELLAELASRVSNINIDQRRATCTREDGSVEVYPYTHTIISYHRELPERETMVVAKPDVVGEDVGKLADWRR